MYSLKLHSLMQYSLSAGPADSLAAAGQANKRIHDERVGESRWLKHNAHKV